jgi:hypothetical protein
MDEELAGLAGWANNLKRLPLDSVLTEAKVKINDILARYEDTERLLACAEAIRSGIHRNTITNEAGITTQAQVQAYLRLLELEKSLYERIIELASLHEHPNLALAIHRNIASLIHAQQIHYQHYLPIPDADWLKLHRLFHISLDLDITATATVDRVYYPVKPLTILNQYCMALLMGCGRLNHPTPAEILRLSHMLQAWCLLVNIDLKPFTDSEHQLVVDITSSSAPNFRKLLSPGEDSLCCYLRVDQLLAKLDSMLPKEQAKGSAIFSTPPSASFLAGQKDLSHDVLRHLKSAWSEYIYREERTPVDELIEVCCGFEAIFFYLCGEKQLKDFIGAKVSLSIVYHESEDKATIEKQRSGDVWSAFLSKPDGILVSGDIPAEFNFQRHFPGKGTPDASAPYPVHHIQMKDLSSRGCQLNWGKNSTVDPEVGSLIGICKNNRQSHWQIGEIAWKVVTSGGETATGVRLLSTSAIPVALDVPLRLARNQNYAEAILAPPEQALGTSTVSLLTQPLGMRQGEYLTISQKGIEEKIHLNQTVKLMDTYEQHLCDFVVKKPSLAIVRPK